MLLDLSYPYHQPLSAGERLTVLRDYMETRGYEQEFFISGAAVESLQRKIARLFDRPAALWCPTGTMAQGIAARLYADERQHRRLLLHPTSHLLLHEEQAYRHVHGLESELIGQWHAPLTADLLHGDAACAVVELPQRHSGGLLPDWQTLSAIRQRAADLGLPLHMDGARIWSCRPYYDNRSYAAIAEGFQSIYVSLYKDIGAMGGAVLIGGSDFIHRARLWRTRLGGLLAAPWPMICDALRVLDQRLQQMPRFVARAQELAASVDGVESIGIRPAIPQVNMFHLQLPVTPDNAAAASQAAADITGLTLGSRFWPGPDDNSCALEIVVGEKALQVSPQWFGETAAILAQRLRSRTNAGKR